jgi:hypothetical protein
MSAAREALRARRWDVIDSRARVLICRAAQVRSERAVQPWHAISERERAAIRAACLVLRNAADEIDTLAPQSMHEAGGLFGPQRAATFAELIAV